MLSFAGIVLLAGLCGLAADGAARAQGFSNASGGFACIFSGEFFAPPGSKGSPVKFAGVQPFVIDGKGHFTSGSDAFGRPPGAVVRGGAY